MNRTAAYRHRWTSALAVLCFVAITFHIASCDYHRLSDDDEQALTDIFRSGLEMGADPFVRAETLRAIALTEDPRLADQAVALVGDEDRMVQVAAVMVLVRADHAQARQRAMHVFNRGDEDVRYQILDLCLRYGNETLRRTMESRALRSGSPRLRLRALEDGLLQKIDQAITEGDEDELRRELWPELGTYVDDDHPEVAATALRRLLDEGQESRAQSAVDRFQDESLSTEERLDAGRILVMARVEQARPAFEALLEKAGAFDPDSLGIPARRVDENLLRFSVLGLAALGDEDFVEPAQRYLDEATALETVEVLDALAPNASSDAAVTLRTHMRDARPKVRRRAIELYGSRQDARADALFGAIRHDDYEAQKSIIAILTERFPDEWANYLEERLRSDDPERIERTLRTMQLLLRTDEELAVVESLRPQLEELATRDGGSVDDDGSEHVLDETAILAAYLLFRISPDESLTEVLRNNPDRQTRYAYLEFLATDEPENHVDALREYLYADLFAHRLLAAVGLWRAFRDDVKWRGPAPAEQAVQEDEQE